MAGADPVRRRRPRRPRRAPARGRPLSPCGPGWAGRWAGSAARAGVAGRRASSAPPRSPPRPPPAAPCLCRSPRRRSPPGPAPPAISTKQPPSASGSACPSSERIPDQAPRLRRARGAATRRRVGRREHAEERPPGGDPGERALENRDPQAPRRIRSRTASAAQGPVAVEVGAQQDRRRARSASREPPGAASAAGGPPRSIAHQGQRRRDPLEARRPRGAPGGRSCPRAATPASGRWAASRSSSRRAPTVATSAGRGARPS